MDINTLIPSSIRKAGESYEISLANFFGYVEGVYYSYDDSRIDYCTNRFGTRLDIKELTKEVEEVFLMSKICNTLWIRVINSNHPEDDILIIAEAAKIVSFTLHGTAYYAILFYDTDGELQLSTSFAGNNLFAYLFENGILTIANRLTETILFTFSFPYSRQESITQLYSQETIDTSYEIYLVHDVLFPEKNEKQYIESILKKSSLYNNILTGIYEERLNEEITRIRFKRHSQAKKEQIESEIKKIIGFIGNHLVFTGSSIQVKGYLSLTDIEKSGISLSGSFSIPDNITLIDPRWHEMRVALMELRYLAYWIEKNIILTQKSLKTIDSLDSTHLEAQEIRSKMTLDDLKNMKEQYQKILDSLVAAVKYNSLSS